MGKYGAQNFSWKCVLFFVFHKTLFNLNIYFKNYHEKHKFFIQGEFVQKAPCS